MAERGPDVGGMDSLVSNYIHDCNLLIKETGLLKTCLNVDCLISFIRAGLTGMQSILGSHG